MGKPKPLSEYRGMWLFSLFDLPVTEPEKRADYARFRAALLKLGFIMLQYSVYARYCASEESTLILRKKIRAALPPEGQVRLLSVTDHQFGKMEVFQGKKRRDGEKPPEQLLLF